jgi:hypothetical protein
VEQSFINMLAGAVSVLFGWILKTVWDAVKDLQKADDELVEKVNKIEVLVAGEYVKREDFKADMDRLFNKLDAIDKKLDSKADK